MDLRMKHRPSNDSLAHKSMSITNYDVVLRCRIQETCCQVVGSFVISLLRTKSSNMLIRRVWRQILCKNTKGHQLCLQSIIFFLYLQSMRTHPSLQNSLKFDSLWCSTKNEKHLPIDCSFSTMANFKVEFRLLKSLAVAVPKIPPPTITTS